jgi:arginyl-tRNA synthetase
LRGIHAPVAGLIAAAVRDAIAAGTLDPPAPAAFTVTEPADPAWGDLTSDVALVLGRARGRSPHEIAPLIVRHLGDAERLFSSVEVGGPGFVNVRLAPAFWRAQLEEELASGRRCDVPPAGHSPRIDVEVSEPPGLTGARAVAVADALARILEARGCGGWIVVRGAGRAAGRRPPGARLLIVGAASVAGAASQEHLDDLGPDAARFWLLSESPGRPLVIDLDVVGRTTENPLCSVQYVGKRMTLLRERGTAEEGPVDLGRLGAPEMALVRTLARLPDVVAAAADALAPERLVQFAVELAGAFHGYYNRGHILTDDPVLTRSRLAVACCAQQVLLRALRLMGIGGT